jgi:hypothetical protein
MFPQGDDAQKEPEQPVTMNRLFFLTMTGGFVRYPNLRYGNPTELAYYAMGKTPRDLARSLRRDERTVRDWLNGRQRVPWWVPEILRLRRLELDIRQRQMGMGALAPRLGIIGADVIELAVTHHVKGDTHAPPIPSLVTSSCA